MKKKKIQQMSSYTTEDRFNGLMQPKVERTAHLIAAQVVDIGLYKMLHISLTYLRELESLNNIY